MKKKPDKRKLIKKMDILASKLARKKGICEHCGSTQNLQCAHVVSRKHLQTRFDPANLLCLCVKCHLYWAHKEPIEFTRWFDLKYGATTYDKLKAKANRTEKFDYEQEFVRLKEMETNVG